MEGYKICREKYAQSLHASGVANRWNKKEEFVIYTGSNRSLSVLELVAHRSHIRIASGYKIVTIKIADESLIKEINSKDLPKNWKSIEAYMQLQEIGSKWYRSNESLVLKVPSAIIPQEHNFIINTKHPLFVDYISLQKVEDFVWDKRLL